MDKDKLQAERKDLEDGIAGLQSVIAKANATIRQAEANIFANQGAMQFIDKLLAKIEEEAKAVVEKVEEAVGVNNDHAG